MRAPTPPISPGTRGRATGEAGRRCSTPEERKTTTPLASSSSSYPATDQLLLLAMHRTGRNDPGDDGKSGSITSGLVLTEEQCAYTYINREGLDLIFPWRYWVWRLRGGSAYVRPLFFSPEALWGVGVVRVGCLLEGKNTKGNGSIRATD
jgi:hypothetical protein